MRTNIMLLISVFFFFVSCKPGQDEEGVTNHLYIENSINVPLEIEYIQISSNTRKQFSIDSNEEVNVFTLSSGLAYNEKDDPSLFDTVYVRYSDKVLVEKVKGEYLLDFYSFIEQPQATYKDKYETHYKRVFTINQDYIDKYTIE